MIYARRLAAALLLLLAGCTSASSHSRPASPAAPSPSAVSSTGGRSASTPNSAPLTGRLYVSIGDSYAAGFQPTAAGRGRTTRNGFAYQVVTAARAKGYRLSLVNFGCAAATTGSILHSPGCTAKYLGPGAAPYDPRTQAAAAEDFLRAHRGKVGLITVSVGGNDVTACGAAANPLGCLTPALATVKANLATLLTGLRAAAGPTTRIVGITYPDVLLGNELSADTAKKNTAGLSIIAFQALINPALKATYEAVGGTFVDVTRATGAYGSMTATTTLPPYGTIPVPVAKICRLTYFCQFRDIHPRTNGYALIADLIAGTLPSR